MTTINELIGAWKNKVPLIWNDPDPIDDNDYTITFVEELDEDLFDGVTPILIQYGEGSEAQVFLHEILYK
jgi:hypothetical protein